MGSFLSSHAATNSTQMVADEAVPVLNDPADDNVSYFNNAAKTPLPPSVQAAGIRSLGFQAHPWRAGSNVDHLEEVRRLFSTLVNGEGDGSDVAITPSTAFAITMMAQNLERTGSVPSGTRVLVLQDEMNSAIYSWQDVCSRTGAALEIVPYPEQNDGGGWTKSVLERIERGDVSVACLPQVHWSDGSFLDLVVIGAACRARNVALVVDGTQSLGVMPFDVQRIDPDAVAASVHKWLLGAHGMSLVYIAKRHHEHWLPLDEHGRSREVEVNDPNWDAGPNSMGPAGYPLEFARGARRCDSGGKPNPTFLPMIQAGLEIVTKYDLEDVQRRLEKITTAILNKAVPLGFRVTPGPRGGHIIGLRPGPNQTKMTTEVMLEIAERLKRKGIHLAVRCGAFRISPYLGITMTDVNRLVDALAEECGGVS